MELDVPRSSAAGSRARRRRPAEATAQALGWFSIALGLAESMMPGAVARSVGLRGRETIVRACGVREIVSGVGLLAARDPTPWVWARVAGDVVDLAALSTGLRGDNPQRRSAGIAMLAVAQVTAVDLACARALGAQADRARSFIDYGDRSGFDRPPAQMKGAAEADFATPSEYRIPAALRPWDRSERSELQIS